MKIEIEKINPESAPIRLNLKKNIPRSALLQLLYQFLDFRLIWLSRPALLKSSKHPPQQGLIISSDAPQRPTFRQTRAQLWYRVKNMLKLQLKVPTNTGTIRTVCSLIPNNLLSSLCTPIGTSNFMVQMYHTALNSLRSNCCATALRTTHWDPNS